MLAKTEKASVATSVDHWLAQFERALAEPDHVLLKTLFHADSHWRDVLALTWHIRTVNGSDAILSELKAQCRPSPTGRLQDGLPSDRAPPRDARGHQRDRSDLPI